MKKKLMFIIGGAAVIAAAYYGYRYFTKAKGAAPAVKTQAKDDITAAQEGIANGQLAEVTSSPALPPPGYSGPMGGPYQWAGMGEPPDGKYVI